METTANFVQLLTVATVCGILGVSRPTVHALVRRGALTGIRVGRVVRIPATDVVRFLVDQGLNPSDIYRGRGSPATASPSPGSPASLQADTGAITH